MNYRLKLALGCMLAIAATPATYGANLLDVYQRALQADPQIREAEATRMASQEAKPQAWAALLPQITASGSKSRSKSTTTGDRQTINPVTGAIISISGAESESTTNSTSWSATLTQSIFRWDQWQALQRADAQVAQAEATYRAAEQDLIVRVISSYFAVLYAQDVVDTDQAALEAFSRQLEQNEKRFEVGLIAITDVQESRAQRDRASADLIDAKRVLATNHELLRELTGEDFDKLAAPDDDMPLPSPQPDKIDAWVSTAMEQNLSLIAARLQSEIASKNVSIARSGHLPSLSLSANYNHNDTDTDTTYQIGNQAQTFPSSSAQKGPSVSLNLVVPIFSGGATQSQVRQSVYTYRAAREKVIQTTRETERAVRDNFLSVLSDISRVKALKQALESSKTSLQATQAGFEVGTRTTVDVLIAQQAFFSAQAQYYKSRYDYLQSRVQLKQAAGQLTADELKTINGYLK